MCTKNLKGTKFLITFWQIKYMDKVCSSGFNSDFNHPEIYKYKNTHKKEKQNVEATKRLERQ